MMLRAYGVPFEREYRFAPPRRWRADFALHNHRILVEVEGVTSFGKNKDGSMRLGRHQTARGLAADCEKYNAATAQGWRVFRYTQSMVTSGEAIAQIMEVIQGVD